MCVRKVVISMTVSKVRYALAYYTKHVYGVPKRYFTSDCDEVKAILSLTGSKTIRDRDIKALATLGIHLKEVRIPDSQK
jgi:hypothetical protein